MRNILRCGLCWLAMNASGAHALLCDREVLSAAMDSVDPPLSEPQREQLINALYDPTLCAAQAVGKGSSVDAPTAQVPSANISRDAPPQSTSSVWPPPKREDFIIRDRISGTFSGWRGKTLFRLDNGQIWVQRQRGYYRTSMENPEITITRNALGFFVLEVVSSGRKVPVKPYRE